MGQRTLGEVRDGSGKPPGGTERVRRHSERSGTGQGPSGRSHTCRETHPEVRVGTWDPQGGYGMGRRTLGEVLDGSGDPRGGPGLVWGHSEGPVVVKGLSERSGTDWGNLWEVRYGSGTLREVQDGSGDPRWGPGRFGGPSERSGQVVDPWGGLGRVEGPSRRCRTGWGSIGAIQEELEDPRGGPGRVGGPSERSGTGRETLREV